MKIQKINNNKIRVIFDYKELEENNISIHSFLSNSSDTKRLISAIINIINEDLNFSNNTDEIKYDTISLSNKVFIVVISKITQVLPTYNQSKTTFILFKFGNINEAISFNELIKNYIKVQSFSFPLYKLKNYYYIKIDLSLKDTLWRRNYLLALSEFKTPLVLNSLSFAYFNENAKYIKNL